VSEIVLVGNLSECEKGVSYSYFSDGNGWNIEGPGISLSLGKSMPEPQVKEYAQDLQTAFREGRKLNGIR
jgi:hypothetical protein